MSHAQSHGTNRHYHACFIHQGNEKIRIIGTDDVHYCYTDQALHSLEYAGNEFSIALVHSPELYDVAAEMGVVCTSAAIPMQVRYAWQVENRL
jgi:hypothetical protein